MPWNILTENWTCLSCWSAGSCDARVECAIWYRLACSKVICLPMGNRNAKEKTEIKSHGPHHMALRRKSVNVFEGAMKVLIMREPSESGAASGAGDDATGGRGAAAMNASWQRFEGILAGAWRLDKRSPNETKSSLRVA